MKLFVAGCSFSDYSFITAGAEPDEVYGEFLSKLMKKPYCHLASGVGSNYRIWRKVCGEIINGNLTSADILIIQYTDFTRNEFFSNYLLSNDANRNFIENYNNNPFQKYIAEPYIDGRIIKFKHRNDDEMSGTKFTKEEKNFLKLYENFFISKEFTQEQFNYHHFMFQNMLAFLKIKTVFLFTPYVHEDEVNFIDNFYISKLNVEKFTDNKNYRRTLDDIGHLNYIGHKVLSDLIYEHIKNVGFLK